MFKEIDQNIVMDVNQPVKGKTYSLFGNFVSTNFFYERVGDLTGQILSKEQLHPSQLLDFIQRVNPTRRILIRNVPIHKREPRLIRILEMLHDSLGEFTHGVDEHLASVPFYKRFTDKELFATREQYYLYMIEFELINQLNREAFLGTDFRIALLPYCLRETQTKCKAETDHIDYKCKGCVEDCYINLLSQILMKYHIEPYIWRNAKLKPLLTGLVREHGSVGILGIACFVELISGMRRCQNAGLPVIGIPLNANRCPRWMGSFHETSVDLKALEKLLEP